MIFQIVFDLNLTYLLVKFVKYPCLVKYVIKFCALWFTVVIDAVETVGSRAMSVTVTGTSRLT